MKADRARLSAVPPPRPVLSREERQELAANWAQLCCEFCGSAHGGLCPRVRRIQSTRLPNGTMTRDITFWKDGQWSPHPNARTPEDVFGPGGVPAIEATASETQPTKKKGKHE